ncbi:hypothetical protein BH24DEI2_BH24DEI2_12820 [soil metagenome]
MIEAAHPLLFGVPQIHDASGDITPADLAALLEISQAQLARTLGVNRQLLNRSPGSPRVQRGLRRVEYLFARVRNLTGSALNARMWLKMGHPDFDGVAPVELLEEGRIEAVEDLVLAIETGSPR